MFRSLNKAGRLSRPTAALATSAATVCAVPSSQTALGSKAVVVRLAVSKTMPVIISLPVRLLFGAEGMSVVCRLASAQSIVCLYRLSSSAR